MLLGIILTILFSVACYFFCNKLHQLLIQIRQKNEVLLYRVSNMTLIRDPYVVSSFLIISGVLLLVKFWENSFLPYNIAFLVLNIIFPFICDPDKNDVLETCELNLGYGGALWYFRNYLTIILPEFLERVQSFESSNKVPVEKKLFLLVPESCIVEKYLEKDNDDDDDDTDRIERCRELPQCKKINSGCKGRVYNLTVYLVKNSLEKKRMVVEYAQPLKGLFSFKEKEFITKEVMFYQRKLFVKHLRKFLKDGEDLHKLCEVVEFSADKQKVSDALLQHCQLQNSTYEIV